MRQSYIILFVTVVIMCFTSLTFGGEPASVLTNKSAQAQKTPCQRGQCPRGMRCERGYCIPIPLAVPKPIFATPIRDAAWKARIELQKQLYINRYNRMKRLEMLLGLTPTEPEIN